MFSRLKHWNDDYAVGATNDKQAVENYVFCETRELVGSLRTELSQIIVGNFKPESLQAILGKERMLRHGSFENWARLMLQWLAAAERA